MHTEVVLDCQGDLPAPKGYRIISSEVDFLKWATEDIKLLIRGQFLCAWAEAFYTLRGRPYSYKESVSAVIQRTFSALTKEQASELSQKIELEAISPIKISASFVLNYCYPEDSSLWQGNASLKHAALWLLWLYSHQPSKAEKIILEHFCKELERRAGDTPERHLYQATDFKQAQLFLYSWMGLSRDEKFMDLGEFPVDVPLPLLNEIKSKWMHRLIESKGNYFIEMLSSLSH